jgi:hypothetical protein
VDDLSYVDGDIVSVTDFEQEVQDAMTQITVTRGFCLACQAVFNSWAKCGPDALRGHSLSYQRISGMEAASRKRCRFCLLLKQHIEGKAELRFRNLDRCLKLLEKDRTMHIIVHSIGTDEGDVTTLALSSPGRMRTRSTDSLILVPAQNNCKSVEFSNE